MSAEQNGYLTDYAKDGTYRLKIPIFVVRWPPGFDRPSLPIYGLCRETGGTHGRYPGVPPTVAQYEADGPDAWRAVVALLPVGTRIQYKETRVVSSIDFGRSDCPLGLVLDDELAKIGLVNMANISKKCTSPLATNVNPDFLELER